MCRWLSPGLDTAQTGSLLFLWPFLCGFFWRTARLCLCNLILFNRGPNPAHCAPFCCSPPWRLSLQRVVTSLLCPPAVPGVFSKLLPWPKNAKAPEDLKIEPGCCTATQPSSSSLCSCDLVTPTCKSCSDTCPESCSLCDLSNTFCFL